MIVIDANAVVALLVDPGDLGETARELYERHDLAHPTLMPFEVANLLRRLEHHGAIDALLARKSLRRVDMLRSQAFSFTELRERIWELRNNLTAYDASYVALAELIDLPLLTFDRRIHQASGPRCQFVQT